MYEIALSGWDVEVNSIKSAVIELLLNNKNHCSQIATIPYHNNTITTHLPIGVDVYFWTSL